MILVQKVAPESIISYKLNKFWRVVLDEFKNMEISKQYQLSSGICNFYWKLSQVFYGLNEDSCGGMTCSN